MTAVALLWIPLGAGKSSGCVRFNGRLYERLAAARDGRPPCPLYHAALEVSVDGGRWTVEMTPVWAGSDPDRGIVLTGPVGSRWLGRSRWFQYEVRCWRDGVVPDAAEAVGGPQIVTDDPGCARRVLAAVRQVPLHVWGRDELRAGDMWNSNSVVAWSLSRAGLAADQMGPPAGGRAPGWRAGLAAAGAVPPLADVGSR